MKVKKGYSILELIFVIAVMSILSAAFSKCFISYKKYQDKLKTQYCSNSIMIFVNSAKQYCFHNNASGTIIFEQVNNKISFYSGGKCMSIYELPMGSKLSGVKLNTGDSFMSIDNSGFTSNAGTIEYKDSDSNKHYIYVNVGTAYVEIKN